MLKFLKLNDKKQPVTDFDTTYNDISKLENAGLLLNNKVVVVDFDGDNENETSIINFFKNHYPTLTVKTTRGYHFYYSIPDGVKIKNGADKITVGGFQVDYKTGTKSYAIVKHKGVMREASRELTLKGLPELPSFMYPLPRAKNITGLGDGDGRNNSLFYHLRLIKEQFKDLDLEDIGNFINDNIFSVKFDDKELKSVIESVTKTEVSGGDSYYGDPSDMISFGKFVSKALDVKIYNSTLYHKEGLSYSRDFIKRNRAVNNYQALRRSQFAELDSQLFLYGDLVDNKQTFNVKLRNGVIIDDNVIDFDCGFTPFFLNVNYDPTAYDENVDNFINFICCDRPDLRVIIEEIIGHVLLVDEFPHKVFFLTGTGANGKSTFVEMITKFAGELSSHIDIANFDDGTSLVSLIGKIVNVADDVDAIYLEKSKNLKTMASGNTVGARAIYSQPITIKNTATLIFTANEPPTFKDKSDGIGRRVVIVPFENKVKQRIHNLDKLLSTDTAKSYLLNLGLAGVRRILDNNNELSVSETVTKATNDYHVANDSVLGYLTDYPDITNKTVNMVYEAYESYCDEANLKAISRNNFIKRAKSLGYKVEPRYISVLGQKKNARVFIKEE